MKSKKKNITSYVIPGDQLGVIEEYIPDKNCYEAEGIIYANVAGNVYIDAENHRISVKSIKEVIIPTKGQLIIGQAMITRKQASTISIFHLNEKSIPVPYTGVLHISNVSDRYVHNMFEVIRPGDWVRAGIIRDDIPIGLTLLGNAYGVILAFCTICGCELEFIRRNLLKCPECEQVQPRLTSRLYGSDNMLKKTKDSTKHRRRSSRPRSRSR
jgi:exosome complex component CSL4